MVGIQLLVMCLLPLIHIPNRALKEECRQYQRLHIDRLIHAAFVDVEAQLLQQTIPWKNLTCDRAHRHLLSEETFTLPLPGWGEKKFKKQCFIWSARKKSRPEGGEYRLLTVEIRLTPVRDPSFFKTRKGKGETRRVRYQIPVVRT